MQNTDFFIHESSIIDENVSIGMGTKIWHFCHISEGVHIGANCTIGQNVFIGKNVRIGNGVKIQNNVCVFEGVDLEDDVFLGPSVVFTNVRYPRAFVNQKATFIKTKVAKGASIGANSTIICGNNIGEYVIIGAGSLIAKSIPAYELWFGNPAVKKGMVNKMGLKIKE